MKKWTPKKCETKYCRKLTTPGGRSPKCGKCRSRQFKQRNPYRYFYTKLKNRARERGHDFTLTFEQYKQFAEKSGYMQYKGKTAASLSIDRIDPERGYHWDNIRAVTLSLNSRLRWAPQF